MTSTNKAKESGTRRLKSRCVIPHRPLRHLALAVVLVGGAAGHSAGRAE